MYFQKKLHMFDDIITAYFDWSELYIIDIIFIVPKFISDNKTGSS